MSGTTRCDGLPERCCRHIPFGSVAGDRFSELTIRVMLGQAAQGVTPGYVDTDEALNLR